MKRILYTSLILLLGLAPAWAEPTVDEADGTISIRGGLPPTLLEQIWERQRDGALPEASSFYLQDINDAELARFSAAFPLATKVEICSHKLTSLAPLAYLRKLETLTVTASAMEEPAALGHLAQLRELSLIGTPLGVDTRWLSAMTGLRSLHLAPLDPAAPVDARSIAKLPKLESLSLGPCRINHADLLAACASVKTVTLSGNGGLKGLTPFQAMPALESIYLDEGAFSAEELKSFRPGVRVIVMEAEPSY